MRTLLAQGGLYAITPAHLDGTALLNSVACVLAGGARIVQYRDKSWTRPGRLELAQALRACCHAEGALFLINDDAELVLAAHADGGHFGQADGALPELRARLGSAAILGVTCHDSLELAQRAQDEGADYVAFGRFFPSTSKPHAPPATPGVLSRAGSTLTLPIVAIGGITPNNGAVLLDAGATWLAAIGSLFDVPDPTTAARAFAPLFPGHAQ